MFQRKRGPTVDWWCIVRNKQVTCPATVRHRGDEFVAGRMGHTHAAEPGVATKLQITAKVGFTLNTYISYLFFINGLYICFSVLCFRVKDDTKAHIFKSAAQLVEDAMLDLDEDLLPASRPVTANLVRSANRLRQCMRPAEPSDLNFEVMVII